MSRPMALALVLLVLFLTSHSDWTPQASSQQAPGPGSGPLTREQRLEMHRDSIKEKIILDLLADVKHLEAATNAGVCAHAQRELRSVRGHVRRLQLQKEVLQHQLQRVSDAVRWRLGAEEHRELFAAVEGLVRSPGSKGEEHGQWSKPLMPGDVLPTRHSNSIATGSAEAAREDQAPAAGKRSAYSSPGTTSFAGSGSSSSSSSESSSSSSSESSLPAVASSPSAFPVSISEWLRGVEERKRLAVGVLGPKSRGASARPRATWGTEGEPGGLEVEEEGRRVAEVQRIFRGRTGSLGASASASARGRPPLVVHSLGDRRQRPSHKAQAANANANANANSNASGSDFGKASDRAADSASISISARGSERGSTSASASGSGSASVPDGSDKGSPRGDPADESPLSTGVREPGTEQEQFHNPDKAHDGGQAEGLPYSMWRDLRSRGMLRKVHQVKT